MACLLGNREGEEDQQGVQRLAVGFVAGNGAKHGNQSVRFCELFEVRHLLATTRHLLRPPAHRTQQVQPAALLHGGRLHVGEQLRHEALVLPQQRQHARQPLQELDEQQEVVVVLALGVERVARHDRLETDRRGAQSGHELGVLLSEPPQEGQNIALFLTEGENANAHLLVADVAEKVLAGGRFLEEIDEGGATRIETRVSQKDEEVEERLEMT